MTDGGYVTEYDYSVAGELLTVSKTYNGETTIIQENKYNHEGIRVSRTQSGTTRNYFYDNGSVAYTTDNGAVSTANILGGYQNVIGSYRGTSYYVYNKDVQGSTSCITSEDGSAAAIYEYSDFGEVNTLTGGISNEIRYTGAIYDAKTGLHYMNARYYDPANGRFITKDTYRGGVDNTNQWHLYVYCANNPINYVDPSGHWSVWIFTWMLETAIDWAVPYLPIIGPLSVAVSKALKPLKYATKKGKHAIAMINRATQKIYQFMVKFKRVGKKVRNIIKKIIRNLTGINVPIHRIWNKIVSIGCGKIKSKILEKMKIADLSMFSSIGSFIANIVDYEYNGYYKGKIPLW